MALLAAYDELLHGLFGDMQASRLNGTVYQNRGPSVTQLRFGRQTLLPVSSMAGKASLPGFAAARLYDFVFVVCRRLAGLSDR